MTAVAAPLVAPARTADPYEPALRWLLFTGVSVFAGVALWRYGLVRLMIVSDRTHISAVIAALYVAASLHNFVRTLGLSRESAATAQLAEIWRRRPHDETASREAWLPRGLVGDHVRDLFAKARTGARLDQTLLLRALAERLRAGLAFGTLAGDALMKLGLLGTIVGFILMLGPVAGLDAEDEAAVRTAMGVMSDGMAIAMYTTLAGLVGSILLKAQYVMLETATVAAFWDVVRLTETRIVPALERGDV